jgi:Rieske Fe-S protein
MNENESNSVDEKSAPNPASDEASRAKEATHSRRAFLFKLSLLANGAVGAVLAVPIFGYLLGPGLKKKQSDLSWIGIGAMSEFPEGETRLTTFRNPVTTAWDGQTGDVSCWVRRISGTQFQVFAVNCAHLGCPVRWFAESKLFLCPCHGGAYYEDGGRASGPPERGLFEYEHRIVGDMLQISAGKMPTLAAKASSGGTLTQIAGTNAPQESTGLQSNQDTAKPRCGSCQG